MEKKLVIMAGLPGSGKSYVRAKKYSDISVIDCDELKKSIPGYDPKNPSAVHEQSKIFEAQEIYKICKQDNRAGHNDACLDGHLKYFKCILFHGCDENGFKVIKNLTMSQ